MQIKFTETTSERYSEMFGVLPPLTMTGLGFLVGEPVSMRRCATTGTEAQTFDAFFEIGDRYFAADKALTLREFRKITLEDVRSGQRELSTKA